MEIKYRVQLDSAEVDLLHNYITKGKHNAQLIRRARCLLACHDKTGTDAEIAKSLRMSRQAVEDLRRRFVVNGFEACLHGLPKLHKPSIMHGENQARLIQLACEAAEDGYHHWSLRTLSDKFVTLEGGKVSHETIRKTLHACDLKPWQSKEWCIPPNGSAEFVDAMERILDTYKMEPDPLRPLVCMDESSKQLVGEVRTPIPLAPGVTRKYDTEYERKGTGCMIMFTAPHIAWRRVDVTERRTCVDWAHQVQKLVDEDFPEAEKITLVCDNLNTHSTASLYKAFEPEEARRLARKVELVHTPKHGSWLNIAEIEFSVLNRTGLPERIATIEELRRKVTALQTRRNQSCKGVYWRLTTEDARVKLANLYPKLVD
jgi:transposase